MGFGGGGAVSPYCKGVLPLTLAAIVKPFDDVIEKVTIGFRLKS